MDVLTFEKRMTLFLGHAKNKGATREELDAIIKMIDIVKKYLPCFSEDRNLKDKGL